MEADVIATNYGTLFGFLPVTEAGADWMEEHLPDDAQSLGNQVFAEHRYAGDILEGMQADGLVIA
jgi:hypothetical protein